MTAGVSSILRDGVGRRPESYIRNLHVCMYSKNRRVEKPSSVYPVFLKLSYFVVRYYVVRDRSLAAATLGNYTNPLRTQSYATQIFDTHVACYILVSSNARSVRIYAHDTNNLSLRNKFNIPKFALPSGLGLGPHIHIRLEWQMQLG